MKTILTIGDAHTEPGENLQRFYKLSKFIKDKKPDYIIIMGDFFDFMSLSSYEEPGSTAKENKRIRSDMDHGINALKIIFSEIDKDKKPKQSYNPEVIFLEGNHEYRLRRELAANAVYENLISVKEEIKKARQDITFIEYGNYLDLENILFTHIPFGMNGAPVSGKSVSTKVTNMVTKSCVYGHTHKLEIANFIRHGDNTTQYSVSVGCFFENTPAYIQGGLVPYWKGLVMFHVSDKNKNIFDIETISMDRLFEMY